MGRRRIDYGWQRVEESKKSLPPPVAGSPRRERAKARGSHPPASHLASPREAERLPRRGAVGEARPRPVHIGVGPLGAGALGRASLRSTPCPGLPPAPEGRCARPVPSHPSFPLPLGRGANPSAHFASPGLRTSSGSGETRATRSPKTERGRFRSNGFGVNIRVRFSACDGRLALSGALLFRGEAGKAREVGVSLLLLS